MNQKPRTSIILQYHNPDLRPFQVGSIVDLANYNGQHQISDNQLDTMQATGLWVITKFDFRQESNINRSAFRNMWNDPKIDGYMIQTTINIELKWFKYAYPYTFDSAWSVPSDFHEAFHIAGTSYMMRSIMFNLIGGSAENPLYQISIFPVYGVDNESKIKDYSQSNRTIEQ
jgi:hypothetical protein